MIKLHNNLLQFSLPQVHSQAILSINFQRTLRIPDDNRSYPLPAGIGSFPLRNVDEFPDTVPANWKEHGGILLPMYQSEAMWLNFGHGDYPFAVKIAAGKINAVTGEAWEESLSTEQNYMVTPDQPWLDGFAVGEGLIRQFVAQPLGEGFTAEEQLTGEAEHGGLQIQVFPMKAEYYERLLAEREKSALELSSYQGGDSMVACCSEPDMGLAPGGLMKQQIYDDNYGIDAWDTAASARCFVHIANSQTWLAVTGQHPPTEPITAEDYAQTGIPWFDYYHGDKEVLEGSAKLAGLDSVAKKKAKQGKFEEQPVVNVPPSQVVQLGQDPAVVREGQF
jgi:hypothetical protein